MKHPIFTTAEQRAITRALNILASKARQQDISCSEPQLAAQAAMLHIGHSTIEQFGAMFLDAQNLLIETKTLFAGDVSSCGVFPRMVVHHAVSFLASGVIVFHNHPTGLVQPSQADRSITKRLSEALATVDIKLLDHFIVSKKDYYSFAEHGLL